MKTLDSDISNLIKHYKNLNHRAVIFLTGPDRLKKLGVVCNLSEKLGTKNILYCYVKDNKRKKTEKKGNRKKGICHMVQTYLQKNCPSEIRWCLYKETQKILGKTFDICIFQDFESLTPNIIARGMETVAGGGFVIFLAPPLSELESYFNTSKDFGINEIFKCHRFLKRFTVSLLASKCCICLDDSLNLLNKKKNPVKYKECLKKKDNSDLICLKDSLKVSESAFYPLVNICATYDQARCLKNLCNSIKMYNHPANRDYNNARYNVTSIVTAARGRGKSAALGLSLCAALQTGVSQICVTSPSPENIATVWEYVKMGLKALDYSEHIDFNMTSSYINDGVKAITRLELKKRNYTQVIRYIVPSETESPNCDLLCIDEAAAIPLSIMRMYMQWFHGIMFISSTVSGYEGTGMALSTQLFDELRQNYTAMVPGSETIQLTGDTKGRLYEISLEEPIRYGSKDPVEAHLYSTMFMNYKTGINDTQDTPPAGPEHCQLVHINRDRLFDRSKTSENVLAQFMSIYSASNSQNSPDDLKSLADDGQTRLLCLTDSDLYNDDNVAPRIIAVIKISYEGAVNKDYVRDQTRSTGSQPLVDSVSTLLAHAYMEPKFADLSGVRLDLIATAPQYLGCGYASHALRLLIGHLTNPTTDMSRQDNNQHNNLIMPLTTLPQVPLHYLAFYGVFTDRLISFFHRIADFYTVHIDYHLDKLTGQCSGILIMKIESTPDPVYSYNWLALFVKVFVRKFSLYKLGPYRALPDTTKCLVDNSRFPDIVKDYPFLPNNDIMESLKGKINTDYSHLQSKKIRQLFRKVPKGNIKL